MTSPEGDLVAGMVKAVQTNAQRLGLTWERRPGTVDQINDSASTFKVIIDGDTAAIEVVSLIGALSIGDRVMVDGVPPGANFAVGFLGSSFNPTGLLGRQDSAASSGAVAAVETTVLFTPALTVKNDRVYRFVFGGRTVASIGGSNAQYGIRETDASGTLFGNVNLAIPVAGAGTQSPWIEGTVYGVSTSAKSVAFVLTLLASAGTMTQFANSTNIRYFEVYDHGDRVADYPNAVTF